MRKNIVKKLKTACIVTTITGLSAFGARAADTQTTTGSSGYSTTTTGSTSGSASASHAAKSFIKEAYNDNQEEIDLGQVAAQKAQNNDLKTLAQEIQKDHTQANAQLQPLAQKYGIAEDLTRGREHQVNKFEKETTGAEFDKKFAIEMLKSHQKAINKFEKAAAKIQEPDVRQYAETMLPKLQEHLQHAANAAREVGVDQSTIASYTKVSGSVGGTSDTQESTTGTGAPTGTSTSGKTDQDSGSRELQQNTPPSRP